MRRGQGRIDVAPHKISLATVKQLSHDLALAAGMGRPERAKSCADPVKSKD